MANDGKFLTIETGRQKQEQGVNTSAGAGDADKLARLDATGRWSTTMMPVGVGPDTQSITASENLSAGDFVNIWSGGVRKADATTSGKEANGFVLSAFLSGASALVYKDSSNTAVSGKTVGDRQYLSTTAGASTATAPSSSGNVVQFLGVASLTTQIDFEPSEGTILV